MDHNYCINDNFAKTFSLEIDKELAGHPLFLPNMFASVIVEIESKHELSSYILHQNIFNIDYDRPFFNGIQSWILIGSFFKYVNSKKHLLWKQSSNYTFKLKLQDEETQKKFKF